MFTRSLPFVMMMVMLAYAVKATVLNPGVRTAHADGGRIRIGLHAPSEPPTTVIEGPTVKWNLPGDSGWKPYAHTGLSWVGIDVDDCVAKESVKATICVKILDAKDVGSPSNGIQRMLNGLFDKFSLDRKDMPIIQTEGAASFITFSVKSGMVTDALDGKVSATVIPGNKGKILMVLGVWGANSDFFSTMDFDVIAQKVALR